MIACRNARARWAGKAANIRRQDSTDSLERLAFVVGFLIVGLVPANHC